MNSKNLPQKYKENFINKIKSFFARFFSKKVEITANQETKEINKINENKNIFKENLINEQVVKVNNEMVAKKSIVDIVEENPELIETLSNENLKKLIKIYEEIIIQNNIRIAKLRKEV